MVNTLGKLPQQGASVRLGPWKVTVRSMTQRRVREVTLQRLAGKGKDQ
ncbi:MAG: transporter associated domain-containing protein [Chthoniobacterales bacterium]